MTAKLMTQERESDLPDSHAPEPERDSPPHRHNGKKLGIRSDSRPGTKPIFLNKQALEEHSAEAIFVDPQSLPLEERIRYYRSEIKKLAPADSFRDEVLFNVYGYLLTQSLRQHDGD